MRPDLTDILTQEVTTGLEWAEHYLCPFSKWSLERALRCLRYAYTNGTLEADSDIDVSKSTERDSHEVSHQEGDGDCTTSEAALMASTDEAPSADNGPTRRSSRAARRRSLQD